MNDIESFLISLLSVPGLPGFEEPVRKVIEEKWRTLADEVTYSKLGSLHALRKNSLGVKCPSVLIAAHMDAIGFIIREVNGSFLQISQLGGIDPRILPGQAVIVHGKREIPGVIQMLPDRVMHSRQAGEAPNYQNLFVDTGLSATSLDKLVQVGDIISFSQSPIQFNSGYIAGHSLDNRASVAALTVCLEEIRKVNLNCDVWGVATVLEEFNMGGAVTSGYEIKPDLAITVDVTFARGPGSHDHQTFPLGKGITIGVGANNYPALQKQFTDLARDLDIPYLLETMPRSSGTDGMALQITASGIPTVVLGIPIRYMHTPVELTALQDIKRAGRLMAKFVCDLDADSLKHLFEGTPS